MLAGYLFRCAGYTELHVRARNQACLAGSDYAALAPAAGLNIHGWRTQMGGPKGVRAREFYSLVVGIKGGMMMHAVPRVAPQDN